MKSPFRSRISRIKQTFDDCRDYASALLLTSAGSVVRTRDEHHEFRQNSNFYYLTGCDLPDVALLVSKTHRHPFLFVRKRSAKEVLWDGALPDMKARARELGAELIEAEDLRKEILSRLARSTHLYFDNAPGTLSWSIARDLISLPSHERGLMPLHFSHCDGILEHARLYKDSAEVALIERANAITTEALFYIAPRLEAGLSEAEIARTIEYVFRMNDATRSFGTIVAAGASAAVLHYRSLTRRFRKGDLVLIDCGAEYKIYAGDITRMLPVGGTFSPWQRDLYQTVLESQKAALGKMRAGNKISAVHDAAARVLTHGLIDLKVLRGKFTTLFRDKAYRPYFPHGIGHPLGLDVHDVGSLRGPDARLETGMVITCEPGLYFPRKAGVVPASGVRIEDNVLITKSGCRILSEGFPKEIPQIEALMAPG